MPSAAGSHRPRNLAANLVDRLSERIRDGQALPGDQLPTESALVQEFGVSRTVVREALSKLQAAGLVETRHGVGTFVSGPASDAAAIRINSPEEAATLLEMLAVLELRLGLEGEAASLAAVRRSAAELSAMHQAQRELAQAIEQGGDSVSADRRLHQQIAQATRNAHFVSLMDHLAERLIPRTRLATAGATDASRRAYLWRVHAEHDSIVSAIANRDPEAARAAVRTHLSNSRDRLRQAQAAAERVVAAAGPRRRVV